MSAIVQDQVDEKKRRWLLVATTAVSAAAAGGVAAPFLISWFPSARALAAGAPVEVDLSKLEAGQQITVEWRGKPVWVLKRTPEMIAQLDKHDGFLTDPQSSSSKQPDYVKGPGRSISPEVFVVEGVCTHLGCSPTLKREVGAASDMGNDWPGGYYCPCHNSRFDLSARVFKGSPAPTNMTVPPHRFASATHLVIGEDTKGA
ncbi:ubiquinol-cytochrome c reductase iron-sulfur subunit [Usitatibacter palustris]|uniref:Ubiquinol-cytochrome c reductase iron-sulfur subunit n=1 Tax=Usitatibacter palustris TaxID=2732487 RepID=A0A6M4HCW3_9PROT|nr:ubiquinol-cytochrome c reductase iron-sulfur subunit [Usitatibacter palustris]QJR16364.1 Ubiquinol-cytochrome c reductase iron-sulfur subunit [Usitatibacter palustris]